MKRNTGTDNSIYSKGAFIIIKFVVLVLPLMMCIVLTACSEKKGLEMNKNKLHVSFGIGATEGRALFTDKKFPVDSQVGVRMGGYDEYNNVVYTAAEKENRQVWTSDNEIILMDKLGTLYTYFPYDKNVDIAAIYIDVADQTDWLYGLPVSGLNYENPIATVTLNHIQANINLSIVKGDYAGEGQVSEVKIQSEGIATKGIFNAAQNTPGWAERTGTGETVLLTMNSMLDNSNLDVLVIPTGTSEAITFTITVDSEDYVVTTSSILLEKGNSYQYVLRLNSSFASISDVYVQSWNEAEKKDDMVMDKV